jgi:UPF0716 protein FxsA
LLHPVAKREIDMPIVFILFIVIPIIEITLLINVGQLIGTWYTVGLVLLSAFIGVNMLRQQGVATLARAQQKMAQGEMPQQEMLEGLVLAVGGALLITPGFVTDFIGFCCLIPFSRIGLIKLASKHYKQKASVNMSSNAHFSHMHSNQAPFGANSNEQGDVFEGEFVKQQDATRSVLSDDKDQTKSN